MSSMKFPTQCIVFLLLSTTLCFGQLQFSEKSTDLGCGNSSFGSGTLGGGISFFDFDNDGWDDITVSSEVGLPVRFFKNNGGSFSEVSFGMNDVLEETKSVIWADFDNDDDYDFLAISNTGASKFYENGGAMDFTDITDTSGIYQPNELTWGASWGDYNNDGWLDIFISSRNTLDTEIYNSLYRNNTDGTFTDVSVSAGISTSDHLTFCTSFFDYNNDGWQDIYLANDRPWNPNILYRNNGDGTFTDVSVASGTDAAINAMSTAIGDYNRDGWLDIYVTNTPEGNAFLRNNGDGTFTDVAPTNGTLMESTAWGAVYLDADNDADLDLYVSSSLTNPDTHLTAAFYENDGAGMFSIPQDAGFEDDVARSYANAIGDIDNDGYPDMVVLNYDPHDIFLWKNETPQTNNWIKVKLQGVESNRQGIGSWMEISVNGEVQYNYTLAGEGYLGQNSAHEFFGIGQETVIDYIKVTWLSGTIDIVNNPPVNEHIVIREGFGILSVDDPKDISNVSIVPNPGSGLFSVILPQGLSEAMVKVFDMQGRDLFEEYISIENRTLDLSSYANGMYVVVIDSNNQSLTKKVVKN